jgi:hypothetical protein
MHPGQPTDTVYSVCPINHVHTQQNHYTCRTHYRSFRTHYPPTHPHISHSRSPGSFSTHSPERLIRAAAVGGNSRGAATGTMARVFGGGYRGSKDAHVLSIPPLHEPPAGPLRLHRGSRSGVRRRWWEAVVMRCWEGSAEEGRVSVVLRAHWWVVTTRPGKYHTIA